MTRRDRVQRLFPAEVVVEEEDPLSTDPDLGQLFPEEAAAVARAIDKRRREFIAGRRCARRALSAFGQEAVALPPRPDRLPPWPSGFVGSITHTQVTRGGHRWGWCGAVVAPRERLLAVGIDAEPEEPIGEELFGKILTEREQLWAEAQRSPGVAARTVFSAKEAFYKAQYLESEAYLGFHDVELDLDDLASGGRFVARLLVPAGERFAPGTRVEGRVAVLDGLIVSVAWL